MARCGWGYGLSVAHEALALGVICCEHSSWCFFIGKQVTHCGVNDAPVGKDIHPSDRKN